jgi:hypothetical protein
MEPYRPLRLTLFIYDLIRLLVMAGLLLDASGNGGLFPNLFYAVPNGLFTLMSFFLWLRLDAYKPYIPLYIGGKILAVVAAFSWLVFSLSTAADTMLGNEGAFIIIGAALLLTMGDALTILGGAVLKKRISGRKPEEGMGCA